MMPRFVQKPSSPLRGVSSSAWLLFVELMETQDVKHVSESGGLGAFDMRPRRLVELGYASKLRYEKSESGRFVHRCEFIGVAADGKPWTEPRFLADSFAQLAAFTQSMRLYYDALAEKKLVKPETVSVSCALAVLHRGGRGALESMELFGDTQVLVDKVKNLF